MSTTHIFKTLHNILSFHTTHLRSSTGMLCKTKYIGTSMDPVVGWDNSCHLYGVTPSRSYSEKGICIVDPQLPCKVPFLEEAKQIDICRSKENSDCDLLPCCPEKPSCFLEKKCPRITIIGGGISGLSAAKYFIERGYDNVIVLEASNRPGGRIISQWFCDTVVELGAGEASKRSWDNPVMSEAVQDGHIRQVFGNSDPFNGLLNDAEKSYLGPSLYGYSKMNKILNDMKEIKSKLKASERGKILDYLSIRKKQTINNEPREMAVPSMRVMYGLTTAIATEVGPDFKNITNEVVGPFLSTPGSDVKIPLGKIEQLADIMRVVRNERVKYDKLVTKVKWGTITSAQNPRAIVTTEDGAEYESDYVLVTLPLTVMKNNMENLFSPPLPFNKVNALKKLPLKPMNKVFVEFSQPFWSWRRCPINKEWPRGELHMRDDWTKGITKIMEAPGSNFVLSVTVEGDEAVDMEKSSEIEVVKSLDSFLRDVLCQKVIPRTKKLLRTTWFSNKFFQGAQCDLENSADDKTIGHLLQPLAPASNELPPVVFFGSGGSSIESGRLSGLRAAEKMITAIKTHADSDRSVDCEKQAFLAQHCSS